jgi:hypothetical protein
MFYFQCFALRTFRGAYLNLSQKSTSEVGIFACKLFPIDRFKFGVLKYIDVNALAASCVVPITLKLKFDICSTASASDVSLIRIC